MTVVLAMVCTVTLGGAAARVSLPGTGWVTGDLVTTAGGALVTGADTGEAGGLWPVCRIPVVGDNMGMPPPPGNDNGSAWLLLCTASSLTGVVDDVRDSKKS